MTDLGGFIKFPVYTVSESKWKDFSIYLSSMAKHVIGHSILFVISNEDTELLCISKNGFIKTVWTSEMNRISKLSAYFKMKDKDRVLKVIENFKTKRFLQLQRINLLTSILLKK